MTKQDLGDHPMTPKQYRAAIEQLGLSQIRAAKLLMVDPRTSRKWALGETPVPELVALLLRLMLEGKITEADIARVNETRRVLGGVAPTTKRARTTKRTAA
jgi:hypothetical protein